GDNAGQENNKDTGSGHHNNSRYHKHAPYKKIVGMILLPARDICSSLHYGYVIFELLFHLARIPEISLDNIDNGTTYNDAIGPGCSTRPRVVRGGDSEAQGQREIRVRPDPAEELKCLFRHLFPDAAATENGHKVEIPTRF